MKKWTKSEKNTVLFSSTVWRDVFTIILPYLNINSLLKCRVVCKDLKLLVDKKDWTNELKKVHECSCQCFKRDKKRTSTRTRRRQFYGSGPYANSAPIISSDCPYQLDTYLKNLSSFYSFQYVMMNKRFHVIETLRKKYYDQMVYQQRYLLKLFEDGAKNQSEFKLDYPDSPVYSEWHKVYGSVLETMNIIEPAKDRLREEEQKLKLAISSIKLGRLSKTRNKF